MKIFNWVVGSFCRTMGRFLFYIAIGLLVLFVLNGKVSAKTIDVTNDTLFYNSPLPYTYNLNPLYTSNRLLDISISSSYGFDYTFGMLNVCSTGVPVITQNGDCTDGCFNTEFKQVITSQSCTTGGFSGNVIYYFFTINQFEIGSGNVSLYRVIDYLSIRNTYNYIVSFTLNSAVLSDEDLFASYQSIANQDKFNSLLENQINQNETIIDQNQDIIDNQEETNDKLNDLNDSLISTDGADLGALQNSAGWLPAGPIDSILNLPLSLLNNLTTNLNKRCQPVILPIPYVNKDLTLPCVNTLYDDMGISGWVTTIGVIASAFIMFSYLLKLYKWVDDTLTFRENNHLDNWGGI